jgi:hypothetical protein
MTGRSEAIRDEGPPPGARGDQTPRQSFLARVHVSHV